MKSSIQHALGVLGCTLILLAILFVVAVVSSLGPSRRQVDALKSQAAPIIEKIERSRASNGEYPATLIAAIGRVPENSYGPWGYSRSEDRRSYHLYTGDFIRFTLSYYSDSGWKLELID